MTKDSSYGEVESVKAVSDVIAPLSGEVLEVNQKVVDAPETVNEDPYGEGWLIRIRLSDPSEVDTLLDVDGVPGSSSPSSSELPLAHRRRPRGDARGDRRLVGRGALPRHPGRRPLPAASSTSSRRSPSRSSCAHLEELAARNVDTTEELSFLGAGIYDHYVPAVVDAVLPRGEFLTAYTPYQPELSQGVLQAIFEYQTAICELTGMDVSNASGYDGTTVAADACYVAKHATGRTKVVLAETMNPQVRQVVKTYAPGFGLEVVEVPHRGRHDRPGRARERRPTDAAA